MINFILQKLPCGVSLPLPVPELSAAESENLSDGMGLQWATSLPRKLADYPAGNARE